MCGSLSGYKPWKDIHDLYSLSIATEPLKKADPQRTPVVRPTDRRPFIRVAGGKKGLDLGIWGFPPPEVRSRPIINARCETVDVLPTFAKAFEKRRCVIPVTGYYEWKKGNDGSKTPWRFSLDGAANNGVAVSERRAARNRMFEGEGGSLFVLAGIFMVDRTSGHRHFAILTSEPNELAAEIHDRMPVILTDSMMDLWLTPSTAPQALKRMCRPYEGSNLIAQPVSKSLFQPPKYVDENQMSLVV